MAVSLSQGAAVAAALFSKVFGEGFVVVPSDDDLPLALAPLFAAFERFVAAGGPNDLDLFIGNFFGGAASGSSVRERRGATPGQAKRRREVFENFSQEQKRMIKAAEEPLFYQVITLLLFYLT